MAYNETLPTDIAANLTLYTRADHGGHHDDFHDLQNDLAAALNAASQGHLLAKGSGDSVTSIDVLSYDRLPFDFRPLFGRLYSQAGQNVSVYDGIRGADGSATDTDSGDTYHALGTWSRTSNVLSETSGGTDRRLVAATGLNRGAITAIVEPAANGVVGVSFRATADGTTQKQLAVYLDQANDVVEVYRRDASDSAVVKSVRRSVQATRYELTVVSQNRYVAVIIDGIVQVIVWLDQAVSDNFTDSGWGLYSDGAGGNFYGWHFREHNGAAALVKGAYRSHPVIRDFYSPGNNPASWAEGHAVMPSAGSGWPGTGPGIVTTVSDDEDDVAWQEWRWADFLPFQHGERTHRRWRNPETAAWTDWRSDDFPDASHLHGLRKVTRETLVADSTAIWVAGSPGDGFVYGMDGDSKVYRKAAWGDAWTEVSQVTTARRGMIHLLGDGHYLCVLGDNGLWRTDGTDITTAGWTQVLAPNGPDEDFQPNGTKAYGQYVLTTAVIRGVADWTSNRYFHLSTDNGQTFTTVKDTNLIDAQIHHHAVCLIPGNYVGLAHPMLMISYHGGDHGMAVEVSDDLGATWTAIKDARGNLANGGRAIRPMTMNVTAHGVVMGPDISPDGVYVLRYADRIGDMFVEWLVQTDRTESDGLLVAKHSDVDPVTGIVYICCRTNVANLPPRILATDGASAAEVFIQAQDGDADQLLDITVHDGRVIVRYSPDSAADMEHVVADTIKLRSRHCWYKDGNDPTDWIDRLGVARPDGTVVAIDPQGAA